MTLETLLTGIAWFILGFTVVQTTVAFLNYLFRIDFKSYAPNQQKLVSVIIPVRNEESTIGYLLNDLAKQSYTKLEIIVVNDDSSDATAEQVLEKQKTIPEIRLINSELKDAGWLGKNHACFRGAREAKGSYLLFLDADVRLGRDAIYSTIGYLQQEHLLFMSVFPRQLIKSRALSRIVPLMNYILLSLLPLFLVKNARFASLSAANGQFMLFDHELYQALEPHKKFRKEKVEDIHIARYIKKNGYRTACLTGDENISCRMYDTYHDAMEGFSKNVYAFFGNSIVLGWLFWLITITGILWMLLLPWYILPLYLFLVVLTRWSISKTSMQNIQQNILIHYEQLWTMGKLLYRALHHHITKSHQWKGRSIT